MSKQRRLVAILFVVVAMIMASGLAAAAGVTWTSLSQITNPPAGITWASTKFAVPNYDGCPGPTSDYRPPIGNNPDGCYGNQPTTHRIYSWSETGSQMYYFNNADLRWYALNPGNIEGAPTAREGACLAWSGQQSSDNGHNLGEQTLVLFGGYISGVGYSKEVNIYNIVNNTWEKKLTSLSPSPSARGYMHCARFSSSGGGSWEYNGIVMSGGFNAGTLSDVWVFCDHADTNPYEHDLLGCGASVRKWVQFSWDTSCSDQSILTLKRAYGSVTELNTRVDPLHNHAWDDEFVIWGGVRDGVALREGAYVTWNQNTGGGVTFHCQRFSDFDGGGGIPLPRYFSGTGYRPHDLLPGLLGMVVFGGVASSGNAQNDVRVMNWERSTSRIYYYAATPTGGSPSLRYGSEFPCFYNEYPGQPGCDTPVNYMMFGGNRPDGVGLQDTWGAYVT